MTLRTGRSSTDSTQARPRITPRLRLKPKGSTAGSVDGAWWPHSDDLPVELPDLLAVLSIRLGPIDRVTYNFADWAATTSNRATPSKSSASIAPSSFSWWYRLAPNQSTHTTS
jgi:hypothetical protein